MKCIDVTFGYVRSHVSQNESIVAHISREQYATKRSDKKRKKKKHEGVRCCTHKKEENDLHRIWSVRLKSVSLTLLKSIYLLPCDDVTMWHGITWAHVHIITQNSFIPFDIHITPSCERTLLLLAESRVYGILSMLMLTQVCWPDHVLCCTALRVGVLLRISSSKHHSPATILRNRFDRVPVLASSHRQVHHVAILGRKRKFRYGQCQHDSRSMLNSIVPAVIDAAI